MSDAVSGGDYRLVEVRPAIFGTSIRCVKLVSPMPNSAGGVGESGSDWQTATRMLRARLAVETHLARIEAHRPLDGIGDAAQRTEAERVRAWLRTEFLDALVD
jgi:hypothetical protein